MFKAIITDIEGTTSSINFVKNVLFPYSQKALPEFVRQHKNTKEVKTQLEATATIAKKNSQNTEELISILLEWIASDQKHTPLKTLQGMIWENGYRNKEYKAHVYPDAHDKLTAWKSQGIELYVYSSGSVKAQELFFGFSEFGDIRELFSGYFDTTTGAKKEMASYQKIATTIDHTPSEILFLSDIVEELDAAKESGMKTCWLIRPDDCQPNAEELGKAHHKNVVCFSDIKFNRLK